MLLRFISDAVFNGVTLYTKGQVVEVPDDRQQASRWIRRGIATTEDAPVVVPPPMGKKARQKLEAKKLEEQKKLDQKLLDEAAAKQTVEPVEPPQDDKVEEVIPEQSLPEEKVDENSSEQNPPDQNFDREPDL